MNRRPGGLQNACIGKPERDTVGLFRFKEADKLFGCHNNAVIKHPIGCIRNCADSSFGISAAMRNAFRDYEIMSFFRSVFFRIGHNRQRKDKNSVDVFVRVGAIILNFFVQFLCYRDVCRKKVVCNRFGQPDRRINPRIQMKITESRKQSISGGIIEKLFRCIFDVFELSELFYAENIHL